MKSWFGQLEARERWMVGGCAVFVALTLFYVLFWQPLGKARANLATDIQRDHALVAELRNYQGRLTPPSGSGTSNNRGSQTLVVLVSQTASRYTLTSALQSSQPSANNESITIRFENAAFDSMVSWLTDLTAQHDLSVQNATVTKAGGPGRVNSTITLSRL